jgi:integrase/recombinase XerD
MNTLISLLPAYRDYLELERALRPQTVKAYTHDIVRLHAFIGDKPVPDITLGDLRGHIRNMASEGLSTETIRRRIHSLNTFYKWLMLEGLASEQISSKLHLPKRVRKQPTWLSDVEIRTFANTPSRLSIAWQILAWFGLRRSELLKLDWRDVRLNDGIIIVRDTKSRDDRVMPIPDAFKIELAREWIDLGMPSSGLVVGIAKSPFARAFRKHLIECGLDGKGITPHTIRHSFASSLIRAGVPLTVVKELLGHKDVSTTMIYVHHNDDMLKDAMNKHILGN